MPPSIIQLGGVVRFRGLGAAHTRVTRLVGCRFFSFCYLLNATKRTWLGGLTLSVLRGKADVAVGGSEVRLTRSGRHSLSCDCRLLKPDEKPRRHLALSLDVNEAALLQHKIVLQAFVDFL
jgi:hypothetical protein